MATIALVACAALIVALGLAHSILGEKYIIRWLLRRDLPLLANDRRFAGGTIRFAWHLTTVLCFGLAAVLVVVAVEAPRSAVVLAIGCTLVASAGLPLWFTRGRHLSWVVMLVAAALCFWFASWV
ncbi:hypothetical protein [Microbacterium sp.]|uniref:hypothetical protein n=1 Tax=Microbacterium sp. TaxID=51671 RepID=UPI0028124020|nr:hypothetical protein [Microbacterium sp.]